MSEKYFTYQSIFINSLIWFVIGCIIVLTTNDTIYSHNELTIYCLCSYLLCIYHWIVSGNKLFSIYVIFIIYALFSNLGQALLLVIPGVDLYLSIYKTYTLSSICEMLRFQALCIAGLNIGACLYLQKHENNVSLEEQQKVFEQNKIPVWNNSAQLFFDFVMYLTFGVMFYLASRQLFLRQTMSYVEMYRSTPLTGYGMRFFSVMLGLISIYRHRHTKLVLVIWLYLFIAYMVAGTRSLGIVYLACIILVIPVLYPILIKKRFVWLWIIASFFGIGLLNIISDSRQYSLMEDISVDSWWMSFFLAISEMGGSMRPSIETMSSSVTLGNPQTILYAFLEFFIPAGILDAIVPHSWTTHLGHWINTLHDDDNEWGFSFIAEAFVNFGWWGWMFMILYGYLIAYLENESYKKIRRCNYFLAACFLAILARQIFYARAQMQLCIDFCRPAFYTYLFYIIFLSNPKKIK